MDVPDSGHEAAIKLTAWQWLLAVGAVSFGLLTLVEFIAPLLDDGGWRRYRPLPALLFFAFAACAGALVATLMAGRPAADRTDPPDTAAEGGRHAALLRELHHRVKNNLQVITSLISLQSYNVEDEGAQRALAEVRRRILVMARAHENLVASIDSNRVDARAFLAAIVRDLRQVHHDALNRIDLRTEIAAIDLDVEQAVAVGQIAGELLANALGHGFPDGRAGAVTLKLDRAGAAACRLLVRDDGVGLPPGLDWRKTNSLGLKLVAQYAEKLGGSIDASTVGPTVFEIRFPLEKP